MLDIKDLDRVVRREGGVSRRLFLAYGAALASLPLVQRRAQAAEEPVTFSSNPYTLGVASGDPDETGMVLWTRLAPKPLEPNGGMGAENVRLTWEVAHDEGFKKIAKTDTVVASKDLAHSVRVEVAGLEPDRWYFFRFRAGDAVSPVGRTRTMPAAEAMSNKLKMAFASCQHYEAGYYTAYEHMAKDEPDLVFHLGDYIYEGGPGMRGIRKHEGKKLYTLEQYRVRHAQYRSDPLLHGMHARCPWVVTWDDHEVENNYASDLSERKLVDPAFFLKQRAAAYQAYYEAMPMRALAVPKGPDATIYRTIRFGRLAEFQVLDTRQYRTKQPNGDGRKELNEAAMKPSNTLLGKTQYEWLMKGLVASKATWNVLAQQVMMGMVGYGKEPAKYSMDQWPGAAHERMKLIAEIAERKVANPVVITGDIHSNWVNNLRADDRQHEAPVLATEFVGTSISSGGNFKNNPVANAATISENPCVQLLDRQRGYVRCEISPKEWKTDFVIIDDVLKPGGNANKLATFVVEAGKPGAKKA